MLSRRLTESREIVSVSDPAIVEIDNETIREYLTTRDITRLGDLKKLPQQPTVFVIQPMMPKYQSFENDFDLLCAYHIKEIRNGPEGCNERVPIQGDSSGGTRMSEDALNTIPRDVIIELGTVIWQLASKDGRTTPFSWRGTMLHDTRISQQRLNVINARTDTTVETSSSESVKV